MAENNIKEKLQAVMSEGTEVEKSVFLDDLLDSEDVDLIDPLVGAMEQERFPAVKDRILLVLDRLVPLSEYRNVDRMLRSPDPKVRNGIVEIIRRSEIPIIRFLEKLAEDEDKDVRKFVIDSLSGEKSDDAIAIIRRRLTDSDINIVYTAVEYLGNFKDPEAVDRIEDILVTGDNLMVICSGLEALAKIGRSPRKDTILDRFMTGEVNPMVNFPLLKYLGTFGEERHFEYIENLLTGSPGVYTKEVVDAVERIMTHHNLERLPDTLRELLETLSRDTGNTTDQYAINKLLSQGAEDTADQLRKAREMLLGADEMAQLGAIELLADIGEAEDIGRLEAFAEDTENDDFLEAIGDAVQRIEERSGG